MPLLSRTIPPFLTLAVQVVMPPPTPTIVMEPPQPQPQPQPVYVPALPPVSVPAAPVYAPAPRITPVPPSEITSLCPVQPKMCNVDAEQGQVRTCICLDYLTGCAFCGQRQGGL